MSIYNLPEKELKGDSRLRIIKHAGLLIAGLLFGGIIAYLLTSDKIISVLVLIATPIGIIFLHRYPFATISIWLFLSPFLTFNIHPQSRMLYWGIHRALPLATLIIILITSVLRMYKRRMPALVIAEWCMIGYVFASILSIYLTNADPLATFYQYYDRVIAPMLLYLVVRFSFPDRKDIQKLLPVIFFIAVSQSIIGFLSWEASGVLPKEWLGREGRTTGSLVNPTVYSTTLIFCSLILLNAAMGQKSRFIRNLLFVVFTVTLVFNFLTFSRAAGLGGILVLIGIAVIYPKFLTKLLVALLIISLLFGAVLLTEFSWVIEHANNRLYSDEAQVSAFSRLPVFYAGVRMFLEKPLVGWGYGNFDRYDRQFQAQIGPFIGDTQDHASHNFFLTLLAEQGAIGFLLFMGPVFYWLFQTITWSKNSRTLGLSTSKLPILLWLAILNEIVVINFSNLRVFFGWGIWWIALALIASMIHPQLESSRQDSF